MCIKLQPSVIHQWARAIIIGVGVLWGGGEISKGVVVDGIDQFWFVIVKGSYYSELLQRLVTFVYSKINYTSLLRNLCSGHGNKPLQ